jgi:glycosyltransferase involved in cell wall biosynthesis
MIAVLAHTHPSVTSGGAEISAYTLYRGLLAIGIDACFIATVPSSALSRVQMATPAEYLVGYEPGSYDHFYHIASPSVTAQIEDLLESLGCELAVFHHFMNFGVNTVRTSSQRRETLLVLHEFLAICHHHGQMVTRPALRLCSASSPSACGKCFAELQVEQFAVRRTHFLDAFALVRHFVSPSEFLKQRFADWGLAPDRVAVIENGVPHLPSPEPANPHANDAVVTVGFFGQINPFKGVDMLLDAVDLLSKDLDISAKLRIRIHGSMVGQSAEFAARFEKLVGQQAILEFFGPYQNERVFDLMRDCNYVLMTSKWWENSPVVIQEAYACGRPLIVPGIGGMKEKIVDQVTGLHFRVGDAHDLSRVLKLACDVPLSMRLRENLPAVSSASGMARAYLDLIDAYRGEVAAVAD